MTPILVVGSLVLGLAIGSFLNVVIWRVPRGESVVAPPSACPQCEAQIRPRDNVPVLGWMLLRGRCRDCGEPISVRYPLVEAATGLLFAGVAYFMAPWNLPAFLYLMAISIALTLIDVDVRRLPNAIVLPSYIVGGVLLTVAAVAEGDLGALLRAVIGAILLYVFYFAVLFAYPAGMGFGDVKLAGVLGLFLGFLGWKELIVGAFLAFLVGGIVSIGILVTGRRRMKIPFGPYMLAGAWLGVFCGAGVADWYLQVAHLT